MKKTYLWICCVMTLMFVGCSTVKGLGEDISTVGQWMTKSSDTVKDGS